ncbi:VanW family protein, partial [Candidatus Uhrbacteria bacterium]|nr:VanW family protein [Candidatus Uhrbacteria bacterium]
MKSFRIHHTIGWSLSGAMVILLLGAIGVGAMTYERAYRDRIFPGVRIGMMDVGGLTRTEATTRVQAAVDAFLEQGIPFTYDGRTSVLDAVVRAPQGPDLAYTLIAFDVPALVDQAFARGRSTSQAVAWRERALGAMTDTALEVPLHATIDTERLERTLEEQYASSLALMEEPRLVAIAEDGAIRWDVREGRSGFRIAREATTSAIRARIAALDPAPVVLAVERVDPSTTVVDARAALPAVERAIARAPLTLTHGGSRWTVDATTLAGWMTLRDGTTPGIDRAAVDAYLTTIAGGIERSSENARFTFDAATKRVREFRPARTGQRIDRDDLVAQIADAAFGSAVPLITIPVVEESAAVDLGATNDFGIRELLGRGESSFAGSPKNRRHNIAIGTNLLNGLLIAPDEEFSLVRAISPFDDTRGYKQELVIKEGKTIPEFGGGLCQVATTLFRAVLQAGLPVLERTNHAYRVPYYEPPVGMDATIYGPKPDFTFRNDTGHHMLLLARVVGDKL